MPEKIPTPADLAGKGPFHGGPRYDKVVSAAFTVPASLTVTSPAFDDDTLIPVRYTADGEKLSPPLAWSSIPAAAESLVLIVEDPDAPGPEPFVHLITWNISPESGGFPEASFRSPEHGGMTRHVGKNSYNQAAWVPPDPPEGHGLHAYVFQLFALDSPLNLDGHPDRDSVANAMADHVIAKGMLTGFYERE